MNLTISRSEAEKIIQRYVEDTLLKEKGLEVVAHLINNSDGQIEVSVALIPINPGE